MKVDLHNHTTLCNHAKGTVEQYIEVAIANKINIFAFSDHAPMDFDPNYRMSFDQIAIYKKMILDVKEIYKSDIEILFAYEVDYLEGHMDERILNADVDFLIGSVHFIDKWGFDNPEFIGGYEDEEIDVIWQKYFDQIEKMADSRLFDIVGHIDLIKVFKFMPTRDIGSIARKALEAIKRADMVLEINVAGYRKPIGEAYPSKELLQKAFILGIPITFGSDAHSPEQVGLYRKEAESLARSVGYTKCATFKDRQRIMVAF